MIAVSLGMATPEVVAEPLPRNALRMPSLIASVRIDGVLDFCGENAPLIIADVRERFEKEMLLTLWDRDQIILWFKRSTRYMPIIEQMLAEAGLPDDLKYVAVIESALRPHVGSPKHAIGFWQFMAETGRKYGLMIDQFKDERRNIFSSTRAAILYFTKLHQLFGSWTLAAAAYNMGEDGLRAEMLAQEVDDYYRLYLPLETQRFVFRILAAKLILSNPETYGFFFKPADFYPPLRFDRFELACAQEIPIQLIARAARSDFKKIKDLNPELRGHYLGIGEHALLLPEGSARGFQRRYQSLLDAWVAGSQERIYVVQKGDNLTRIAERFNVPLQALYIWNRLPASGRIHPGDRLIVYSPSGDAANKSGP